MFRIFFQVGNFYEPHPPLPIGVYSHWTSFAKEYAKKVNGQRQGGKTEVARGNGQTRDVRLLTVHGRPRPIDYTGSGTRRHLDRLHGGAMTDPDEPRDARRLFLGNLPKAKTERDICDELKRVTPGLVRAITYKNPADPSLHRGFCFLDYDTAAAAADAKRRLSRFTVFGCKTVVDWADPEPEPAAEQMAAVRVLFVRQCGGVLSETALAGVFGRYGRVERVKNLKNYAFVHFARRADAQAAADELDGSVDECTGVRLAVSWAKPPADKRVREHVLRQRERRMRQTCGFRSAAAEPDAVPVAVEPYTVGYDHYRYDFGWTAAGPVGCACRWSDEAAERCGRPANCPCAAAVAAAAASAAAFVRNDGNGGSSGSNGGSGGGSSGSGGGGSSGSGGSNGGGGNAPRPRQRYRQRQWPWDDGSAAGGGDCPGASVAAAAAAAVAASATNGTTPAGTTCGSTVDDNIRKFFYKVTVAGGVPPAGTQ